MKHSLASLRKRKLAQQPLVALTAYDAAFAHWAGQAGVDIILVGDSLGMVVQGHDTTVGVTLEQMVYHCRMVQRAEHQAWCIVDMPFMADATLDRALDSAEQLIKQGGADMVKLEGGQRVVKTVAALSELGVPVCGHLGLLPQSVLKTGYKVQGREQAQAKAIYEEALALEQAGAEMLVLECVPSELAAKITQDLSIPVIGIGAGRHTDGQVLVSYDLLGLTVGKPPKFSHNFLAETGSIQQALSAYVDAVKQGHFPRPEHEMN